LFRVPLNEKPLVPLRFSMVGDYGAATYTTLYYSYLSSNLFSASVIFPGELI
jgi:hypothetical protein